ncbi:GAF domain-containing protein [Candidatus Bathyarchaeota archaeon]|nr:GAF domain-containing protein [Candidatus Bathyarchaeota archaeon]
MQRLALDVLQRLNRAETPDEAIEQILTAVKEFTGVSAVGIRLRDGDDYPYYYYDGFSDVHVEMESSLCGYDDEGNLIRGRGGKPVLECMCGLVIQGRTDGSKPFFTEGGSFHSNNTSELLRATITDEGMLTHTRNVCNAEGYESVALIPLRSKDSIIGLLQLNDEDEGRYTEEMILFLEGLGESIGIALAHMKEEERRRNAEAERERLLYRYMLRLRELNTLYNVSELLDKPDLTVEEAVQGIVELLPAGMQYPEAAVARIVVEDKEFKTDGFRETGWRIESPIRVYDKTMGSVEVHYLEEKPESFNGPFLEEEAKLLDAVSEQVFRILEHREKTEWQTQLDRYALILSDEEVRHLLTLVTEDISITQMDQDGLDYPDVPQEGSEQLVKSCLYLKNVLDLNWKLLVKLQSLLGG